MRFKSLYIRDFGIYNNVSLNDISQEIVVIGGNNRAGKSTLLDILRYFPYGFSKAMDIPPARIEYEVEGKFIDDNKNELIARVNGYSKPHIFGSLDIENIKSLYGDVDLFTYKEIFTISLDELKYIGNEDEKLQSVLLGAGLKDVISIPRMISDFKREAEKIGGKNGNPKTKLFKESYNEISQGIDLKEKALIQVEKYNNDIKRIGFLENDIHRWEIDIKNLGDNIFISEILKVNYQLYKETDGLKLILNDNRNKSIYEDIKAKRLSLEVCTNLREEYSIVLNNYERVKLGFSKNTEISDSLLKCFKLYGNEMPSNELKISGISQKIKNYKMMLEQCKKAKQEIVVDATDINEEWKDDFTKILEINTEEISFVELSENIDKLKIMENKTEDIKYTIQQFEEKLLELKLSGEPYDKNIFVKNIIIVGLFLIIGFLMYNFNNIFGVLISIAGIIITFLNITFSRKTKVGSSENSSVIAINLEISKNKNELSDSLKNIKDLNNNILKYKQVLQLKNEVPTMSIKIYFTLARDLKKKVLHLKFDLDNMSILEKDIKFQLRELLDSLVKFKDFLDIDELNVTKNLIENSEYLFKNIKNLSALFNTYEKLSAIIDAKFVIEEKIKNTLNLKDDSDILLNLNKNIEMCKVFHEYKSNKDNYNNLKNQLLHSLQIDRVKKILSKDDDSVELFQKFEKIVNDYIDMDHIKRDASALKVKYETEINTLNVLKDERTSLKDEVNRLFSSEDITIAHNKIENGRRKLKKVAEEYAVNSAATFILQLLQNDFIQGAKNTILNGTGKILSEITDGQFSEVLPVDNLTKTDFKTVDKNGVLKETMKDLSRGTKEQLFLAVRLSRIGEIKSKLPVIIDDSLVNFDAKHLYNSIKLLSKLSKTNQIFFLTCHSEVVNAINKINKNAQNFKLSEGKFYSVSGDGLEQYLKGGIT